MVHIFRTQISISAIAILQIFVRCFKCRMSDKTLIYQLHILVSGEVTLIRIFAGDHPQQGR